MRKILVAAIAVVAMLPGLSRADDATAALEAARQKRLEAVEAVQTATAAKLDAALARIAVLENKLATTAVAAPAAVQYTTATVCANGVCRTVQVPVDSAGFASSGFTTTMTVGDDAAAVGRTKRCGPIRRLLGKCP